MAMRGAVWVADPTTRLRPVPELQCCLAYLPPQQEPRRRAALHGLNLTTWLVLSMCDGRADGSLAHDYDMAMANTHGPGTRPGALAQALLQLQDLGLIHRIAERDRA
jgi:hypothetical protein